MSWKTINEILGLAAANADFGERLLQHPVQEIQRLGFVLTAREQEVLSEVSAKSLSDLCQYLLDTLAPDSAEQSDAENDNSQEERSS